METADKLYSDGRVKESIECFTQLQHLLQNIYGSNCRELGYVYKKLSSLYFSQNDHYHSLLYQKQSFKVYKQLYSMDHPLTTHSLMQLSHQYQKIGLLDKALKYTTKSLYFTNVFGSEGYNDSVINFVTLANIFQSKQQH